MSPPALRRALDVSPADAGPAAAPAAVWERARLRLKAELGEDVFASWFARLELVGFEDDAARFSVPTRFLKSWIEAHYAERILRHMQAEGASVDRVALDLRGALSRSADAAGGEARAVDGGAPRPPATAAKPAAGRGPGSPGSGAEAAAPPLAPTAGVQPGAAFGGGGSGAAKAREGDPIAGSPLDPRLTFEGFHVGEPNRFAHAAARQVAGVAANLAGGRPAPYNPLYIHAGVGRGKTHLLQAVAHAARAQGARALYLTADRFMHGFVAALRAQNAVAFKDKLRAIDLLVIDDVQFLQGRTIQQEFCHTLNALIDAGRQVVVAADCPAQGLESLDERVRSRLAGGLSVEIGALDETLRRDILSARAAAARAHHPGFDVPGDVLDYVARAVTTNGRDLEGAVNRLVARATLAGAPLTLDTAERAIADLVRNVEPKRVKIEDIQKLVASHYNVSKADILSPRRTASVVKPRQIAMYLSKILTPRSLPEIGRRFGDRDHTTVLHAVRKIQGLVTSDDQMREEVDLLKRMLQE